MYSRRPKESHLDTVRYEIEMLDFCAKKLTQQPQEWSEGDRNVYLEGFLIHFRNLLCFFSGKHHKKDTDLSTAKPEVWVGRQITAAELDAIKKPAENLDKDGDEGYHDKISRYIQHCTSYRCENDINWDVEQMYRELDAIITAFEQIFPRSPDETPRRSSFGLVASGIQTVRTQAFG